MTRWKKVLWVSLSVLATTTLVGWFAPSAMAQGRGPTVSNADNPALQPFRSSVDIAFVFVNEQQLITTVPAGKRLVIQNLSYSATMPVGTELVFGGLRIGEFGTFLETLEINPPHVSASASFVLHDGSQPTTGYFEPGEEVWLSVSTSNAAANRSIRVTFSGYFVNL